MTLRAFLRLPELGIALLWRAFRLFQAVPASFPWPQGKRAAVSLTFDARKLVVGAGTAMITRHGSHGGFQVYG